MLAFVFARFAIECLPAYLAVLHELDESEEVVDYAVDELEEEVEGSYFEFGEVGAFEGERWRVKVKWRGWVKVKVRSEGEMEAEGRENEVKSG